MVEWTETQTPTKERELEYWTVNFDESSQLQGVGAGILVTSLSVFFELTNNRMVKIACSSSEVVS
jgi:hypothetical protein